MIPATAQQISAIHAAKARLGLDEDSYRHVLEAVTGKRSAKQLSAGEAGSVIERFKVWTNPVTPADQGAPAASGALRLEGSYAGVCRALWIAVYNLGLANDRTDRALVAFVTRQTGIAHLNWVREGTDAARVIEALKSWIAREAGVAWDADKSLLSAASLSLMRWRKLEIIRAQIRRLEASGDHGPFPARLALDGITDRDLDRLSGELGRRLRKARERRT
ncbi:regulatory protein GemA [Azorhizobium doebereinerae]|uniref:regulatory protein GemA n=1 Tax=Azorhizobium doebereinerae TaxID=281091 RepID=UPI000407705D|nr:regulatory protein GemA [Azorhizobium doebereinerae]